MIIFSVLLSHGRDRGRWAGEGNTGLTKLDIETANMCHRSGIVVKVTGWARKYIQEFKILTA